MTMDGGSVTVNQTTEVASGSGLALAIYNEDLTTLTLPTVPILGDTTPPYRTERPVNSTDINTIKAARIGILNEAARRATAYARATISYIQTNGHARISTSTVAGRTPNPNNANTDIQPPLVNVDLQIL